MPCRQPTAQSGQLDDLVVYQSAGWPALPHLIVGHRRYPATPLAAGQTVGPGFGMNYLVRGRGLYRNYRGREYPLQPGCVFFRCGEYPHTITWDHSEPVEEYFLSFSWLTYEHLEAVGLVTAIHPPVVPGRPRPARIAAYESLLRRFATPAPDAAPALLREVLEFIARLRQPAVAGQPRHPHQALVDRAKRWVTEHPEDRTELTALADRLGVSYSLLRQAFRAVTGQSLSAYRRHARLQIARLWLDRYQVQEAAARLGYPDAFAFSKQFKQAVGISPKQFQLMYYRRHRRDR